MRFRATMSAYHDRQWSTFACRMSDCLAFATLAERARGIFLSMSWRPAQRAILRAVRTSGTMRFGTAMIANHALTLRTRVGISSLWKSESSLSLKDFAGPSPPARLAGTCLPARLSGCDPHCWMCVHVLMCSGACLQYRLSACRADSRAGACT